MSPHEVIFQFNAYFYESPEEAQSHPQCCFSGEGSASIQPSQKAQENQPITNLKPRTFANATVTIKKVKDSNRDCFFAQIYMIQAE